MKLIIYTDHYAGTHEFCVDMKTGDITYGNYPVSGQWKLKGFRHVKRRKFISFEEIQKDPKLLEYMPWRYKNGRGQWRVRDLDHNTIREWGDRVVAVELVDN